MIQIQLKYFQNIYIENFFCFYKYKPFFNLHTHNTPMTFCFLILKYLFWHSKKEFGKNNPVTSKREERWVRK